MAAKKVLIYPFLILSLFFGVLTIVVLTAKKIGYETNAKQRDSVFYEGVAELEGWTLFIKDSKWYVHAGGPFLFQSSHLSEEVKKAAKPLDESFVKSLKPTKERALFIASDANKEMLQVFMKLFSMMELKRVYVVSPFQSSLSNLKKLESRFFYALSPKTILKWRVYSGLFMQEVFSIEDDFILIDEKTEKIMGKKLLDEVFRRGFPVLHLDQSRMRLIKTKSKEELRK